MLIKVEEKFNISKQGRKIKRRIVVLQCDGNHSSPKIFKRNYEKKLLNNKVHFCSHECLNAPGMAWRKIGKLSGKDHPNFGAVVTSETRKKLSISNIGKIPWNKGLTKETDARIAHQSELQTGRTLSPEHVEASRIGNVGRKFTKKHRKNISIALKLSWKNKSQNEITVITKKVHKTKKRNGSYGKSGAEDKRYEYLCEHINSNNIERQISINGWSIDFYDYSCNEYEEFRGDYFHGRNYTHEELIEMAEIHEAKTGKSKSQYRTIAGTKLRDAEKEQWFADNGLALRIVWETDFIKSLK